MLRAERAGQRGCHGEAEQDDAGSVVEQAFAFEQDHELARQCDALQHGLCCDGVRRRDDRA